MKTFDRNLGVADVRVLIKANKIRKVATLNSDYLTRKAKEEAINYLLEQEEFLKRYIKVDMREFRIATKKYYVNNKSAYTDGYMPIENNYSKIKRVAASLPNGKGYYVPLINEAIEILLKKEQEKYIKNLKSRRINLSKAYDLFCKLTGIEYNVCRSAEFMAERYGYKSLQQVPEAVERYKKTDEYKKERGEKLFVHLFGKFLRDYGYDAKAYYADTDANLREKIKKEIYEKKENLEKYGVILENSDIKTIAKVKHSNFGYCVFLDALAQVDYSEDKDWNYYSKKWHRQHGPKITIASRRVTFYKKGFTKTIYIDSFRGDYILKAYIEAFKVRKIHYKDTKKKRLQLDPHFKIRKIKEVCGVELYARLLNNFTYDYVAYYKNTTFHAFTKKEAIAGLKNKINKKFKTDKEILTYKDGKKLGFCDTGIRSFCEVNGLDCNGSYTRAELKKIVAENREANKPFVAELKQIELWAIGGAK